MDVLLHKMDHYHQQFTQRSLNATHYPRGIIVCLWWDTVGWPTLGPHASTDKYNWDITNK